MALLSTDRRLPKWYLFIIVYKTNENIKNIKIFNEMNRFLTIRLNIGMRVKIETRYRSGLGLKLYSNY